jgi:hypothetical protein
MKDQQPESASNSGSAGIPFLAWIVFSGIFYGYGKYFPAVTTDINNSQILNISQQYASYSGIIFGFLSMLLMYLFFAFGLRRSGILFIIGFVPWLAFGYQLAYREPRYAEIAKAIISFLGEPLLYSSAVMVGIGLLWFIISLFIPRHD